MKDEAFIQTILKKGQEAKEKARREFSDLTSTQLNWKPSVQSWSIGQCLDHLIQSHVTYFPKLKMINQGSFRMNFWERFSPFTAICGRLLIKQVQEQPKRKLKAPKKIQPSVSEINGGIVNDYQNNLDQFLEYISNCGSIDIDKTIILSPITSIVTYSLRDAFQFLLQHEHRHLNQATRVKTNAGFPA